MDYLFVSSDDNYVLVVTTDGEYLNKLGEDEDGLGVFQQPWGIAVDWNRYILVSDS